MSTEVAEQDQYERLFVYGIFLNERTRNNYGMLNPRYETVLDYVTFGQSIVEARYLPNISASLTGLVVDMPISNWDALDMLEAGYKRVRVQTTSGELVYMYVGM